MNAVDWPLRFIPRRSPPAWLAFLVSVGAVAGAIALRAALLGPSNAWGLSATYFPAFILATLYAGPRWGWAVFFTVILMGVLSPVRVVAGVSPTAAMVLFYLSGALTVLVSSWLRAALVRLEEAHAMQQRTQAALDESEARLRLAQEAGSVGLWDWNVITGEGHWSPVLYRNLGLDPAKAAGVRDLLAVVHPDDRATVRELNITAVKEGKVEPLEYRVVWPDGSVHWLLTRGEIIRDEQGRIARAVGVNIDITDRRVAFEQVRESEARFRTLADSTPVLMWVSNTDGTRAFVNDAYVQFLGEPYEAALAFDWRKRLDPDDLERILAEQVAGEASREFFTLEARYRRADGAVRWIRSFSQPRYEPSGEFGGFIGIGFDVTDAKRAETDLKRINELLAERIDAALAERDLAEAALRRSQKLEAVGQLTGGVAHDFNNLLTVVIGALDLIQRHPHDEARRERMVEAAMGAARRGERLTHQLLAFARRQTLKPEVLNIDALLLESEPLLRRAVGEAVTLTVTPAAGDARARTDPGQFEAAVMNLVVNARDAVSQGGAIRVESTLCRLAEGEVEEVEAGDYVSVAVHDTGAGMSADTLARAVEPFFTTKDVGKGTGLGLSQVYGFARQSGGGVAIASTPGKGTTVRIYLPHAPEAVSEASAEARPGASGAEGPALSVLLVEDDPQVADMVATLLEDLGHAVHRADGVAAALRILKAPRAIDLMLTDLVMPGPKSGVDLAHEAVRLRPGLPVILSSGYTGEALSSADGAPWPLLRKPYASNVLAKTIAEVMDRAPEVA